MLQLPNTNTLGSENLAVYDQKVGLISDFSCYKKDHLRNIRETVYPTFSATNHILLYLQFVLSGTCPTRVPNVASIKVYSVISYRMMVCPQLAWLFAPTYTFSGNWDNHVTCNTVVSKCFRQYFSIQIMTVADCIEFNNLTVQKISRTHFFQSSVFLNFFVCPSFFQVLGLFLI